jgi:LemA protein
MFTAAAVLLAILIVVVLAGVAVYNTLVALNRRCDQAEADIDVQLKQRHDLIPNLVETVKGYAGHERGTLEAVMRARNAAAAAPAGGAGAAEGALGAALGRLMAVAEAYPDLKANANFAELQAELGDIENKIAAARRYLNGAVTEYNTTREQFPGNVIGKLFEFAGREVVIVAKEHRGRIEAAPVVRF